MLRTIQILILLLSPSVFGQMQEPNSASLDDGPHICWKDSNTAIVSYYCNNEIIKQEYGNIDTLHFDGLCYDSSLSYVIAANPPSVEPDVFVGVSRILAVSDIHGEYDEFVDVLIRCGVINNQLRWQWGDGHLVVDGDVFDRGTGVTECLWLIYRLEQEAKEAGGRVHFILGNHELMALRGRKHYIHSRYKKGIIKQMHISYDDLFGPDMELGRWLRTKLVVLKLNNILFVHGGIHPKYVRLGLSIAELNSLVRSGLDLRSDQVSLDPEIKQLRGRLGPPSYRGLVRRIKGRYEKATTEQIDSLLGHFGVSAIVVGHSERNQIGCLHDCRVITLDMPVVSHNAFEALLWEDGHFFRIGVDGERILLR